MKKFSLTNEQILTLCKTDMNFLRNFIEEVSKDSMPLEKSDFDKNINHNIVLQKAYEITMKNGPRQKITSIKELRKWSKRVPIYFLEGFEKCGHQYLTLMAAKKIIENFYK